MEAIKQVFECLLKHSAFIPLSVKLMQQTDSPFSQEFLISAARGILRGVKFSWHASSIDKLLSDIAKFCSPSLLHHFLSE